MTAFLDIDSSFLASQSPFMSHTRAVRVGYTVLSAILICISMTVAALRPVSWSDPLDLAELHSFRLVYFKHKEIFLVVCIVSDGSPVLSMPAY